jgi:hypothetical protein
MLLESLQEYGIIGNQSGVLSVQKRLQGIQVVCIRDATCPSDEICYRVETEEPIARLSSRYFGRGEAFDGMQEAAVHREAMGEKQCCQRTISRALVRTSPLARAIPD